MLHTCIHTHIHMFIVHTWWKVVENEVKGRSKNRKLVCHGTLVGNDCMVAHNERVVSSKMLWCRHCHSCVLILLTANFTQSKLNNNLLFASQIGTFLIFYTFCHQMCKSTKCWNQGTVKRYYMHDQIFLFKNDMIIFDIK